MVQVPKDHVREAFVAAAAEAFAELGFSATSMAQVAERAGSSVGNLYKYFGSKDALFEAAVPPGLVAKLERLTRARVRALGDARDVRELSAGAPYYALAGELLSFCFAHRAAVVLLLTRAEGTPYASFAASFEDKLVRWALQYARVAYPSLRPSADLRWVLGQAYRAFLGNVAEVLREFPTEARARAVIELVTARHQAGLKRLFEITGGHHAEHRDAEAPPVLEPPAGQSSGDTGPGRAGAGAARPGAGKAHRRSGAGRRR